MATDHLGNSRATPTQAQATTTVPALVTMNTVSTASQKHLIDEVIIGFTGALNAGEADATTTYRLATAGKGGSFTAKNATVLELKLRRVAHTRSCGRGDAGKECQAGKPDLHQDSRGPAWLNELFGRCEPTVAA